MNESKFTSKKLALIFVFSLVSIISIISFGIYFGMNYYKSFYPKSIVMNFSKLDVFTTPEQQALGYQFRTELCDTCGGLFDFPEKKILSFWMKNTLIDIDIIYLDENKVVVNRIIKPQKNTESKQYSSITDAKYALEILSSRADMLNINIGDKLLFDY